MPVMVKAGAVETAVPGLYSSRILKPDAGFKQTRQIWHQAGRSTVSDNLHSPSPQPHAFMRRKEPSECSKRVLTISSTWVTVGMLAAELDARYNLGWAALGESLSEK